MLTRLTLIAATTLSLAANASFADQRKMVMVAKPKPQQMVLIAPNRTKDIGCPEGWVQAAPPLNWQLGCLPNTLTLGN